MVLDLPSGIMYRLAVCHTCKDGQYIRINDAPTEQSFDNEQEAPTTHHHHRPRDILYPSAMQDLLVQSTSTMYIICVQYILLLGNMHAHENAHQLGSCFILFTLSSFIMPRWGNHLNYRGLQPTPTIYLDSRTIRIFVRIEGN
jgi:hypothetical protein